MVVSAHELCPLSNIGSRKGRESSWGVGPREDVEGPCARRDISVPELKDELTGFTLGALIKLKRDDGGCLVCGFAVLDDQKLILGVLNNLATLDPASVGSSRVDDVFELASFEDWHSQGDRGGRKEEGEKLHVGFFWEGAVFAFEFDRSVCSDGGC